MITKQGIIILFIVIGATQVFSKAYENNFSNDLHGTQQTDQFIKKRIQHNQSDNMQNAQRSYASERFSSRKKIQNESISNQNGFNLQSEQYSTTRIRSSRSNVITDIIIGSILFFAAFPTLWYNEKGYAYTKTFLRKYLKICKTVDAAEINPQNENQLICVQGDTQTNQQLIDSTFDVKVNNCIRLTRKCEMYQWIEERNTRRINDDEEEVYYTYQREWRDEYIESRNYAEPDGHENHNHNWLYNNEKFYGTNVTYGAFKLTEIQNKQCKKEEQIPVNTNTVNLIASRNNYYIGDFANPLYNKNQSEYSNIPNAPPPAQSTLDSTRIQSLQSGAVHAIAGSKTLVVKDNYLYFKNNLASENSGDFRVMFTKTPCGPITVIGQQSFGALETFRPEESGKKEEFDEENFDTSGCCCTVVTKFCQAINAPISEINWVAEEKCKKKKIFQKQLSDYELKTWLMRLLGFCCLWFGQWFMLSPVYSLLYWFPLVGRFLGAIGSFICGLVGFLVAIPFTILIISVAWLFYRKEIGIPLLVVSLLILGYFIFSYRSEPRAKEKPFIYSLEIKDIKFINKIYQTKHLLPKKRYSFHIVY